MTQLYHTFISYSRADGEFALKIATDLRAAGVNVWLDQLDIPPGARWDRAVEDALETSGRILVILSPHSAGSENVQDEIGLAFDKNKPIIPILSVPCEVPMRLRRLQHIDFTTHYDQALQTLLTVMKLPITAPEDSTTSEAPAPTGGHLAAQAESRPQHSALRLPDARPLSAVIRPRNLFITLGAVVFILLLVRIWDRDTGNPAPTHQSVAAQDEQAAGQGDEQAAGQGDEQAAAQGDGQVAPQGNEQAAPRDEEPGVAPDDERATARDAEDAEE